MWRLVATAAVAAAVILGCAPWLGWADARAAGTAPGAFSVRASGAGKPVRSPVHGGKCAKGQQRAVLARAAALASLASELRA
jgi:hypothetical protein